MKKLLFMLLAILGLTLTACSSDEDDAISALDSVRFTSASYNQFNNDITISVGAENVTDDMVFTLYYGPETLNVDLNLLSSTQMVYDKASKKLTANLSMDDIKDKSKSVYGAIVAKDIKTNLTRRFTNAITIYAPLK